MQIHASRPKRREITKPRLEVAQVFARHGRRYLQTHHASADQRKVIRAIEHCRTAVLGGHMELCTACGHRRPAYNSCRNRHCPKCQALAQHEWLEARKARIVPTHHFHVVFTLPAQLRGIAQQNPKAIYDLMFRCAADTLLELGRDRKRLGALLGLTTVLHTWTRELAFHPHVHCIVTGGGLALDGPRWVATPPTFLFPVRVMSKLFRGKLLAGLRRLSNRGELELHGKLEPLREPSRFDTLIASLFRSDFVVYAKPPFGGATHVYAYLGRYTHRVGLSNQRLRSFDDRGVCFATKHGKTVTLPPLEFIRRFLLHVLPKGFVKLRHYGLLAARHVHSKLQLARRLLGADDVGPHRQPLDDVSWRERFYAITGIDLRLCPQCRSATMVRLPLPSPSSTTHALQPSYADSS